MKIAHPVLSLGTTMIVRLALLFLGLELALPSFAAEPSNVLLTPDTPPQITLTNQSRPPLSPGPNDAVIAYTAARMLEDFHYLHLPFDTNLSSKFLDLYVNRLDLQHSIFLQSDLAEFAQYRDKLGEMTKEKRDTTPAYIIFNRYMERMTERTRFAREFLHSEYFTFNGNEKFPLNRKTAPFPKNIEEARTMWGERLRAEYLDEKLNRENPKELAQLISTKHTPIALGLLPSDLHQDIVKVVETRYTRVLRNFHDWESDKVLETYLTALAQVYDPHSDYEDRDTLDNFAIQMSLSLFGIGAVLTTDDDGYCKIVSLSPGMPAARSKKIKPGDRIAAVAQGTNEPVDVIQMPLNKVVAMIRGPKGTEVRLTMLPSDSTERTIVGIVRDEIKLEEKQAKAKIIELPKEHGQIERLGIIDLPSFYASFSVIGSQNRAEVKSATLDVTRLLEKLKEKQVDGVILDLRNNGGGSLPEAIDLTGLFIKQGPVVQVASSDGTIQVDEDRDPTVQYDGPLVVLANRFSASASEIVAGALQDYGRAVVIGGNSTHGKGTVQSMSQLAPYLLRNREFFTNNPADLGALKYTTNKFYRVNGSSTQLKGVIPDIILPSTYDYVESEESTEENAMKWDEIKSTDYDKLNRVQPYLADLSKKSARRVAASRDFAYVKEDIDIVKKLMADKTASLNEMKRLKDNADKEQARKIREAELKGRQPQEAKIFDLTLKHGEVEMVEEKPADTNSVAAIETKAGVEFKAFASNNKVDEAVTTNQTINGTNTVDGAAITEAEKPKTPPILSPEERAPLEEAEHILMDYISLMHDAGALTADVPKKAP